MRKKKPLISNSEVDYFLNILTNDNKNDNLTSEKTIEANTLMRKITKLKRFCDLSKIKYREKTNQYYIYINRVQFSAVEKNDLIDKLFTHFCGESVRTLEAAFTEWMLWRKSIVTNSKTLKENLNEWNHYIANSPISKIQVAKLSIRDFEDFYYSITANYSITSKRLSNITTVLNGIMKRCVSLEIITHNILADIDKKPFYRRCMPARRRNEIYSLEERSRILNHLKDRTDIYSLAISLSFYFCLRIGELTALKYSDVKKDVVSIMRSKRTVEEMQDDFTFTNKTTTNDSRIKGNKSSGFRDYPLLNKAKLIIERIHTLYPDDEFLLMNNGMQLIGDTFNEKLKATCRELGINYLPSHQIRFTVATMLFENSVPISQISLLLGHADTATTWHYIRQQRTSIETIEVMNRILC